MVFRDCRILLILTGAVAAAALQPGASTAADADAQQPADANAAFELRRREEAWAHAALDKYLSRHSGDGDAARGEWGVSARDARDFEYSAPRALQATCASNAATATGQCGAATACTSTGTAAYTTRALAYNAATGVFTGTITTNQCVSARAHERASPALFALTLTLTQLTFPFVSHIFFLCSAAAAAHSAREHLRGRAEDDAAARARLRLAVLPCCAEPHNHGRVAARAHRLHCARRNECASAEITRTNACERECERVRTRMRARATLPLETLLRACSQ